MTAVFLTGASGYIGKHTTLALLNAGYTVRGSVRSTAKGDEVVAAVRPHLTTPDNLADRLHFVELDLNSDHGWSEAMAGCDVLLHTASPFVLDAADENQLVRPAVDGTVRALRGAQAAGIRRVVLTSSVVAIYGTAQAREVAVFDESMWTDVTSPIGRDPYNKSKTLAEQAAWEFVRTEAPEMQLTVINPGVVLGPPLDRHYGTSVEVIGRIVAAKDPAVPDLAFPIVDVVDVADLHVAAIDLETSYGRRFVAAERTMSFLEIATAIKAALPGRKIVTRRAPSALIRVLGLFDKQIRATLPMLGLRLNFSNQAASETFGITFRSAPACVVATAHFLVDEAAGQ